MPTDTLKIGSTSPGFTDLPATDGRKYSLKDFADTKGFAIVFSCNHCPYVQAYEDRMIAFQREYAPKGIRLIAINSNETDNHPEDSFEEMVRRAQQRGFNFPYLRDEDQSIAKAFGATHTPEFFLFDGQRKLRYRGKMDDNHKDPLAVNVNYLRDAADAILANKDVKLPETYSIGCTIKWK
ncbi:MAG: thioredoxin family protein [Ignavibacteria bacterium]|nr:thioredoxin family protein [Ignavibacteria bacterium]